MKKLIQNVGVLFVALLLLCALAAEAKQQSRRRNRRGVGNGASEATQLARRYLRPPLAATPAPLNNTLFWGTYRPQVLFGMRTRSSTPLSTGLLWSSTPAEEPHRFMRDLRYTCEQGQDLTYSWQEHDGREYGTQTIVDRKHDLELVTSFVKLPSETDSGHWRVRLDGKRARKNLPAREATTRAPLSLFLVFSNEDLATGTLALLQNHPEGLDPSEWRLSGVNQDVGAFTVRTRVLDRHSAALLEERRAAISSASDFLALVHELRKNHNAVPRLDRVHFVGYRAESEDAWDVNPRLQNIFRNQASNLVAQMEQARNKLSPDQRLRALAPYLLTLPNQVERDSNVFVFQLIIMEDVTVEMDYVQHVALVTDNDDEDDESLSTRSSAVESHLATCTSESLDDLLQARSLRFEERFQRTFELSRQQHSAIARKTAKTALSNLLGGVGFFSGSELIEMRAANQELALPQVVTESPPGVLFSGVPSRPFFPRGFLWDEGFHQLLISEWDLDLSLDVFRHWLNRMDDDGWIAREQILGPEARSRVPAEFQVQRNTVANPPTFFLLLRRFVERLLALRELEEGSPWSAGDVVCEGDADCHTSEPAPSPRANPQQLTDAASLTSFLRQCYPRIKSWYQWMERTQRSPLLDGAYRWADRTVNHTLSSGLDDYPRANPPTNSELHVDITAWQAMSARVLVDLAHLLELQDEEEIAFVASLEERTRVIDRVLETVFWNEELQTFMDVAEYTEQSVLHVEERGYVSLFPMLLGLIAPDDQKLEHVLNLIEDPEELWSNFGVLSLSKSSALYETNENYWRGPIWINVNFLILSSLHRNYIHAGPYHEHAHSVYTRLRENLMNNIVAEYDRTHQFWEQYNAVTGHGQRTNPFTGWTTLIVNIMSEHF